MPSLGDGDFIIAEIFIEINPTNSSNYFKFTTCSVINFNFVLFLGKKEGCELFDYQALNRVYFIVQ